MKAPSSTGRRLCVALTLITVFLVIPVLLIVSVLLLARITGEPLVDVRAFATYWKQSLAALLVLVLGYGLLHVRERRLQLYGTLELFVAFSLAFHSMTNLLVVLPTRGERPLDAHAPSMLAVLALVGAVYLAVNGFDNVMRGRSRGVEDRPD